MPGSDSSLEHDSPRILLYSHDSWGLGHLRRSLNLAGALGKRLSSASLLVCSGSPCATHFPLPRRTDVVKLPAITKDRAGKYTPRKLGADLGGVLRLRAGLLLEAFRTFRPDLLIVDHQVVGLEGELEPVLRQARKRGALTILGLRDIIDAAPAVRRQWSSPVVQWALREAYDRICVYGSQLVFDPRVEYEWPRGVRERVELTGYVVPPADPPRPSRRKSGSRRRVLLAVGGGEDGIERIDRYLDFLAMSEVSWRTTIVTGPLMPAAEVRRLKERARGLRAVRIRTFHGDLPRLLRQSDAVVCMAGYNTAVEALQSGRPIVFLPRTFPRAEQLLRASRLAKLGLCDCLVDPSARELGEAVERALARGGSERRTAVPPPEIDLDGGQRLARLASELLDEGRGVCEGETRMAAS